MKAQPKKRTHAPRKTEGHATLDGDEMTVVVGREWDCAAEDGESAEPLIEVEYAVREK